MSYWSENVLCILWLEIASYNKILKSEKKYNSISNCAEEAIIAQGSY